MAVRLARRARLGDRRLRVAPGGGRRHCLPRAAGHRPAPRAGGAPRDGAEALVVGRLEARKGTPLLLRILPRLLRRHPGLRVRFVGTDNSRNDGWFARHGRTYADSFRRRHPEAAARVRFEGYLPDGDLEARYRDADLLLVPSRYESFGLIYLEAMRSRLPVATFAAGGASEVFERGEEHGALLVPPGDGRAFAAAVSRLLDDRALRERLGAAGRARYEAAFTAAHMADATLRFYGQVLETRAARPVPARWPVRQVMHALDTGDAVSAITQHAARVLGRLGHDETVLVHHAHPGARRATEPVRRILRDPDVSVLMHFWNYNPDAWILPKVRGRKAVYYHNVTPPEFFAPGTATREATERGLAQLRRIADAFDLVVADSRHNLEDFGRFLRTPRPGLVVHPVVDAEALRAGPFEGDLVRRLRRGPGARWLFVGRVARNKRQERVMTLFDRYARAVDPAARLWLVGNDTQDPAYRAGLEALRRALPSGRRILFTGPVGDRSLRAYYRAASLFVCASEHEGFGLPLVEAMAYGVPVIAFAAAAVPETMGAAGILARSWDAPRLVELAALLESDAGLRARILAGQRANLERFGAAEAERRLAAAAAFLSGGTPSAYFETVGPGG